MELIIPIFNDLSLTISDEQDERKVYPTARLQKGLVLNSRGLDLAEEAVGFGLPVLKRGLQTVFPGNIKLDLLDKGSPRVVTAIYTLDLVEKIARPGTAGVRSKALYSAKNFLAASIRQFPPLRAPLTALSNGLRRLFGLETIFEPAGFSMQIKMVYGFNMREASLQVEADMSSLPLGSITEMMIMNEQGAHYFDRYCDSSGTWLSGKQIGCWDEVTSEEASFLCSMHRIAFTLPRIAGARLFRGRELIGSRLAWSGFGYSVPPGVRDFRYTVRFEKLP
jgi:hypothetical protein